MKPAHKDGSRRQRFAEAIRSATDHFNAANWADASVQARLALSLVPKSAAALNLLAGATMGSNRPDEAIPLFKRAVAAEPKSPFLRFNLGEAYRRSGAHALALPCFERAAALKPDFGEAIALAGECLHHIGRHDGAERHFRNALKSAPGLASALHGLGLLELQRGASAAAAEKLSDALAAIPPGHSLRPSLLANLGCAYLQMGEGVTGLAALAEAVEARRDDADLWRLLATSLRHVKAVPHNAQFRRILTELLARSDVNPRNLATATLALLAQDENTARLLNQIEDEPGDVRAILESNAATAAQLVGDPLFRNLLASAPVPSIPVELLLVQLRSDLLTAVETFLETGADERELAICLARQSHLNEYVYYVSSDEQRRVERLLRALDNCDLGNRASDATSVAILASYRPLDQTALAKRLDEKPRAGLADVLREQVDEPKTEDAIRATLPVLKPATDATSLAVQGQYEESPYPRWTRCSIRNPLPFESAVRSALPHLSPKQVPAISHPRILIAGCGTGLEVMRVVNSYLGGSILAIDLSASSLAYAARKCREYDVCNVEFMQADILDLPLLCEKFDLIESFGVIHHMADPHAGLAVLAGLLKPAGMLSIGLYSEIGRRAVVEARTLIDREGYSTDLDGIRSLRRNLMLHKPPSLAPVMSPASDFWTSSDCRDLLFHVNEHRFTLPQISEMLRATGLAFLGVEFSDDFDRTRFLHGQENLAAVQDVTALHRYEIEHPEVFGDTYRIWVRRQPSSA